MTFRNILYTLPLLLTIGCSDATSVTGTVKLADGQPLTAGYVSFESATTNVIGPLDKNGHFSLFQIRPGDRVPPGTYRGMIVYDLSSFASAEGMNASGDDIIKKYLPFPVKYTAFDTSGLTVTVEKGKPVKMEIVLE
jgi:hypothetical protein